MSLPKQAASQHLPRAGEKTEPPTSPVPETLEYVRDISMGLLRLVDAREHPFLCYLIEMTVLESDARLKAMRETAAAGQSEPG